MGERAGIGGRAAVVAAALLFGLMPLTPIDALAGTQARDAFTVSAAHNGSAVIQLDHAVRWRPLVRRPAEGPVTVAITSTKPSPDVYFAMVLPSGNSISGRLDGNGGSLRFSAVFGFVPRWAPTAPLHLQPGRYRVTVVTDEHAAIRLAGTADEPRTSIRADRPTKASAAHADIDQPSALDDAYQSLGVTIPEHAHLVLTLSEATWSGRPTVDYEDSCLSTGPAHVLPCPIDPTNVLFGVDPEAPDGDWTSTAIGLWEDPPTGDANVDFYAARSVQLKHRSVYAVALP
jgi:hypothetical protein